MNKNSTVPLVVIGGAVLYYLLNRKSSNVPAITPAYGSTFSQPSVGARTAAAGAAIASGNSGSSNALLRALSNIGSALSSLGKQSSKGGGGGGGSSGGGKNVSAPKTATTDPLDALIKSGEFERGVAADNALLKQLDAQNPPPYFTPDSPVSGSPWDGNGGASFSGFDALGSPIGDPVGPTDGNNYFGDSFGSFSGAGDNSGLGNAYDSGGGSADYSGGFDSIGAGGGGGEPTDYSVA